MVRQHAPQGLLKESGIERLAGFQEHRLVPPVALGDLSAKKPCWIGSNGVTPVTGPWSIASTCVPLSASGARAPMVCASKSIFE